MSVVSRKEYIGVPRDRVENFNGNQLVYVGWDNHLLFASAFLLFVSPETVFRDMVQNNVIPLIGADPDAEKIDWDSVTWLKGNQPWTPNWDETLAANGIGHKMLLRFKTPSLNSICG
ncbi:phenol hydroxylase subunit P4 [Marinobacter pelagius]|uniref:Phenol 2-monooxygenase P4 subunit n=1 Tax=Marinobacter pelagius TaxID=379482 RepID=A0A1I4QYD2_9GAMM|nr:phenol hydroxylase subunit P4 [Marinobacter pelagius]SFM45039.1 phenol 2-monooxygenase P4 subunit [Marinobacter pelagius]